MAELILGIMCPCQRKHILEMVICLLSTNSVGSLHKLWRESDSEQKLNLRSFHLPLKSLSLLSRQGISKTNPPG